MKNKTVLLFLLLLFFFLAFEKSPASENEYLEARDNLKSGNQDFAFINFQSLLENNPKSKYRKEALFAVTEYYFLAANYREAFNTSLKFLENYPDSKMRPFILFYMLKISQAWENDALIKTIQTQIKNLKRIVLVFKEREEYGFKTPLGLNYKVVYYIDKLEFYLDGKLRAQISY